MMTSANLTETEITAKIAQYEGRLYDYIRNQAELNPGMLLAFAQDLDVLNHMLQGAIKRRTAAA